MGESLGVIVTDILAVCCDEVKELVWVATMVKSKVEVQISWTR
jgi:hypothetical protein